MYKDNLNVHTITQCVRLPDHRRAERDLPSTRNRRKESFCAVSRFAWYFQCTQGRFSMSNMPEFDRQRIAGVRGRLASGRRKQQL